MKRAVYPILLLTATAFWAVGWGCHYSGPTPAVTPSTIEDAAPRATIRIDGMACPFCTYNIQRQVEAVEGVEHVDVSLEKGEAHVTLSEQNPPTAEQLRAAVESAGFTARQVRMP